MRTQNGEEILFLDTSRSRCIGILIAMWSASVRSFDGGFDTKACCTLVSKARLKMEDLDWMWLYRQVDLDARKRESWKR